jgi:LPXTG-motif cell wall-anchored protein
MGERRTVIGWRRGAALAVAALLGSTLTLAAGEIATPQRSAEAGSVGAVNILMDRPGTTPKYGANTVVQIEAGNINFVGNCDTAAEGGKPGRQKAGLKDWFQPWADIYVVPSTASPTNNEPLTDVGGSYNSVFGGLGGSFLYEPLGLTFPTGKLPAGVYAIVVDECQNGVFDTGEDSYLPDVFQVVLGDDVPPLSPEAAAFQATKAKAAGAAGALSSVQRLLALKEAVELLNKAADAGAASLGGEQMVAFLIGQGAAYLQEDSPYGQLQERGKKIAKQTVDQVQARFARIAADPPDTSFQQYALPSTQRAVFTESSSDLDAGFGSVLAELDVLSGLAGAIVDTAERYQGADAAGNGPWARRHARELQALLDRFAARMPAFQASVADAEAGVNARYGKGAFTFADGIRDLGNVHGVVTPEGAERTTTVANSGVDLATARNVANAYDQSTPKPEADSLAEWLAMLDALEDQVVAFAGTLGDFADQAGGLEDQLVAGVPSIVDDPDVDIALTGTPRAGAEVTLTLDGAEAGDSVRWDLDGDGSADDALGDTTTWTVPGNAEVGVPVIVSAVLSRGAQQASAVEVVEVVSGGNRGPVVTAADRTIRTPAPGGSTSFAVTASDPDGDPIEYAWVVDGQTVDGEDGSSFTLDVGADDFGGRWVEVFVTDGKAVRVQNWFVVITPPDADGDGFRAAPGPDCDDSTNAVSPIDAEVFNNGRDDDCDPETPDDGSRVAGSISILSLRNQARSGGEVLAATQAVSWSHPQRFQNIPFRLTVDWGDGSAPEVHTRQGTTTAATTFPVLSHQYLREQMPAQFEACIEVVGTGAVFCARYPVYIVNNRPLVNGADLRTWGPSERTDAPDAGARRPGEWVPADPDGRLANTNYNSNNAIVLPAGQPLPGGYGRASLSHQVLDSGDDDFIGLVFGYQPGEVADPDADYVGVTWVNQDQDGFSNPCNDAPTTALRWGPDFTAWRATGVPLSMELFTLSTFHYPYDPSDDGTEAAQYPGCDDDQGITRLGTVPKNDARFGGERWLFRAATAEQRQSAGPKLTSGVSRSLDPYLIEYDYQPDSLTVWVNGEQQLQVHPADPSKPFPPGRVGLYMQSLDQVRAAATDPEPTYAFVQGRGGPVSGGDPDGISMPMHDDPIDSHTATIEWGDGSSATQGAVVAEPTKGNGWWRIEGDHVYERSGTFRGKVCATDAAGLSSCFPFTATVAPAPPVVDAGPDRAVGAEVDLDDMSFQDPGPYDTHTATIDWGDGGASEPADVDEVLGGGSVSADHEYAADGTYEVELCVTDQDDERACDARELEVVATQEAPVAQVSDELTVPEGSEADIGVGFTDANPGDVHTATVDWGDGDGPQAVVLQDGGTFGSATATTTFDDDGTYPVAIEVCDEDACSTATTSIVVTNVDPVVDAAATVAGGDVEVTAEVTDPGTADTHTATVDWGEGAGPEGVPLDVGPDGTLLSSTHRYATPGARTITVCATDDDGATGCDELEVEIVDVDGVAPTVAIDPIPAAVEGDVVTLTGQVGDDDDGDLADVTVSVDPGDGRAAQDAAVDPDAGTWTVDVTWPDDGTFDVDARACDPSGRCTTATAEATIANADPEVDAGRDRTSGRSAVLEDATYADPGTNDVHTATVDWGDGTALTDATVVGTAGSGTVQGAHDYATDGTFEVEVCVTDDDGGEGCDSFELDVATSPITVTVAPTATVVEGSELVVDASFADPLGGGHTAVVRWSDGSAATPVPLAEAGDGRSGSGQASHTYADDGVRAATIEVCSTTEDRCGSGVVQVTTTNAPPVPGTAAVTGGAGSASVQLPFTDPGVADTHTATIDWGDGQGPKPVAVDAATHKVSGATTYGAGGSYPLEVCVVDDDGGQACVDLQVEVGDPIGAAPELALDDPADAVEGDAVALVGTITDDDSSSFSYEIEWGDGTSSEGTTDASLATSHAYGDEGRYTVTATVGDGGLTDVGTVTVDVANGDPALTLTPMASGLDATILVELTDPGDDELTATVDWGDGTIDTLDGASARAARAEFEAEHRYDSAGTRTAEVCGRDPDGGRACETVSLSVQEPTTTTTTPTPTTSTTSTSTPIPTTSETTPPPSSGSGGDSGSRGGGASPGPLPRTGADLGGLIAGGVLLIASGALVLARRRRRLPT